MVKKMFSTFIFIFENIFIFSKLKFGLPKVLPGLQNFGRNILKNTKIVIFRKTRKTPFLHILHTQKSVITLKNTKCAHFCTNVHNCAKPVFVILTGFWPKNASPLPVDENGPIKIPEDQFLPCFGPILAQALCPGRGAIFKTWCTVRIWGSKMPPFGGAEKGTFSNQGKEAQPPKLPFSGFSILSSFVRPERQKMTLFSKIFWSA